MRMTHPTAARRLALLLVASALLAASSPSRAEAASEGDPTPTLPDRAAERKVLLERLVDDVARVDRALETTRHLIEQAAGRPYLPDLSIRLAELYVEKSRYLYVQAVESRPEGSAKAIEEMFLRTHTRAAPWTVIRSDDKKRARLNCMRHFLSTVDYPGKDESIAQLPDPLIVGGAGNNILGRRVLVTSRRAFGAPPLTVPADLEPRSGAEKLERRAAGGVQRVGGAIAGAVGSVGRRTGSVARKALPRRKDHDDETSPPDTP